MESYQINMLLLSGDPALDYIGTGGAEYPPEDSVIPSMYMYQLVFYFGYVSP